ncbi:MAG: UDP-N-acetylmuramoyl-tripeptide--D-alanyl-D-alanine ligase [Myxococcota bacterium]
MSWSVETIAAACQGALEGDARGRIRSLSTDSRSLQPGALFVAIVGEHFDGHDFLAQAEARGATAALVQRHDVGTPSLPLIRVTDTVQALGKLAAARRSCFDGPVIAITGSNGKTTTKEMCASILSAAGRRVHRSEGNLNNQIGLPLSILGVAEGDEVLVLELGMNHPGEIAVLARIARPDVGAVTQIAPAHLGLLGSLDAIAAAKGELYEELPDGATAVVNADDPHLCVQAERFAGQKLRFGFSEEAALRAESVHCDASGVRFTLHTPRGHGPVRLSALGRHLVQDALCAAAAAWASEALGSEPLDAIRTGLERFEPLAGRLRPLTSPAGFRILDDSYNANPDSLRAALTTLVELARGEPAVVVLGEMLELGAEAERLHAEAGRDVAKLGLHALIGVGELPAHAVEGARAAGIPHALACAEAEEAAREARRLAGEGGLVLVKGSRGARMERIVAKLREAS